MEKDIVILHLEKTDGTPLFLHPFKNLGQVLKLSEESRISGFYGKEPRPESITLLRNDLYRQVELAVKQWIGEKRFIPRFLLSSALFMALYFFLSYAVRDPIPMIDELAISLGASVLLYVVLSRRGESSQEAGQKRIMLRGRIDAIYFDHDPALEEAEKVIASLDKLKPEELSRGIDEVLDALSYSLPKHQSHNLEQLAVYLSQKYGGKKGKKQQRIIQGGKKLPRDFALFGLYKLLSRQAEGTRK